MSVPRTVILSRKPTLPLELNPSLTMLLLQYQMIVVILLKRSAFVKVINGKSEEENMETNCRDRLHVGSLRSGFDQNNHEDLIGNSERRLIIRNICGIV